jgi:hypothetical protein
MVVFEEWRDKGFREISIGHSNTGSPAHSDMIQSAYEQKRKSILIHLAVFASLAAYWLILSFSGIGCPIRAITGIPCPACGMTRAIIALLHLDIASYWYYNPAALLIVFAILLGVHIRPLNKYIPKRILHFLLIFCALIIFIVWLIRVCFFAIPITLNALRRYR